MGPLEIVIFDDASTDGSFEIVQDIISKYRGHHQIQLHRNQKNLGVVASLNRAVNLASGELLIQMGDDDISEPHRAARIFEEWIKSGKTAHTIFSNAKIIDENGKAKNLRFAEGVKVNATNNFELCLFNRHHVLFHPLASGRAMYENWVLGATQAFSKASFSIFGPLHEGLVVEDRVIPFRSLLLGEVRFIDEDLVFYRRHGDNFWPDKPSQDRLQKIGVREYWNRESTHRQAIQDLVRAAEKGLLSAPHAQKHIRTSKIAICRNAFERGFRMKKICENLKKVFSERENLAICGEILICFFGVWLQESFYFLLQQVRKNPRAYHILKEIKKILSRKQQASHAR